MGRGPSLSLTGLAGRDLYSESPAIHRRARRYKLSRFDPTHAIRFDFERGRVTRVGASERLLVASDALVSLLKSAGPAAAANFGRQLGTEIGRLVSERFDSIESASLEEIAEHLGGELALLGLGSLAVEQWGRALVLRFDHCPVAREGAELLARVIEGAVQRALSRTVTAVVMASDEDGVRIALLGDQAAERVSRWLSNGVGYADALSRLQAPGGGA